MSSKKQKIVSSILAAVVIAAICIGVGLYLKSQKDSGQFVVMDDKESDPVYLNGYGVTKDYVCVKLGEKEGKLKSLPGEDTPLSPTHRRYLPGDVVPQGLDCDRDYDQRIVSLNYYEKSYADLAGAVKKWHIPLPQKVTVKVWYAEGLPYMRVPHKFPCTMEEFKGRPCRRWIAVKCVSTFSGCYSANIFEISDADPNFTENVLPGSNDFIALCYKYSHSVDANVDQKIYNRYKLIDRDRDFYFHRYEINSDGLWITQGAHKFPGVRDKSSWRTTVKWFSLWRLKTQEDF